MKCNSKVRLAAWPGILIVLFNEVNIPLAFSELGQFQPGLCSVLAGSLEGESRYYKYSNVGLVFPAFILGWRLLVLVSPGQLVKLPV